MAAGWDYYLTDDEVRAELDASIADGDETTAGYCLVALGGGERARVLAGQRVADRRIPYVLTDSARDELAARRGGGGR